jgi:hypothetical protein
LRNHLSSDYKYGLFICSIISNSDIYKNNYNFILYSSITYSDQSTTNQQRTVHLQYGLIRIISTNSSNNRCRQYSSFYLLAISHSFKWFIINNLLKQKNYYSFCLNYYC